MSKVMIKGRIAGKPAGETNANYTRFEIPVLPDGKKEPVLVETYGLHSFMDTVKEGTKVSMIADRRTRRIGGEGMNDRFIYTYTAQNIAMEV